MNKELLANTKEKIEQIEIILKDTVNENGDLSLFCGSTGHSLFHLTKKIVYKEYDGIQVFVKDYFDNTFKQLQESKSMFGSYNLCLGYSVIIWYYV